MTTITLLIALLVLAILMFVVPALAGEAAAQSLVAIFPQIPASVV